MGKFTLVSADSHVVEPADLWQQYIPSSSPFRDRAPRVQRDATGSDVFYCEGLKLFPPGNMSMAGKPTTNLPTTLKDVYPGAYDPHARLREIAVDGIQAEVLYPSVVMRLFALTDLGLKQACFEGYNSWLAEFCQVYPESFKGIGVVAIEDIEGAVWELRRTRKQGLAGAMIAIGSDDPVLYATAAHDPFWAVAEELGIPVSLHLATSQKDNPIRTMTSDTLMPVEIQRSLANMIFGGLFHRFPKLNVISVENDAGWVAYFAERMDYLFNHEYRRLTLDYPIRDKGILPSEYLRRNVSMTFIQDRTAVEARSWVGVENLMWSNDYPHNASTWPSSRRILDRLLAGVPVAERQMIVAGNAERLYWAH